MSKKFTMIRVHDQGGVSGTGRVLDGIEFENGKIAVSWMGKGDVHINSVTVYDSFTDFETVHINSHPGNETKVIWEDDPGFLKLKSSKSIN